MQTLQERHKYLTRYRRAAHKNICLVFQFEHFPGQCRTGFQLIYNGIQLMCNWLMFNKCEYLLKFKQMIQYV